MAQTITKEQMARLLAALGDEVDQTKATWLIEGRAVLRVSHGNGKATSFETGSSPDSFTEAPINVGMSPEVMRERLAEFTPGPVLGSSQGNQDEEPRTKGNETFHDIVAQYMQERQNEERNPTPPKAVGSIQDQAARLLGWRG